MNTEQFLRLVLPNTGLKVLAELVQIPESDRVGWRYSTFQSFAAMAEAALQLDAKGRTVYHACNAYGDWYFDEKKQKRRLRTQQNVVACRALYDDIDVGKPGSYATRNEAVAALREFIHSTGLPSPFVIASGGGLHLYWPLDTDVDKATWDRLAGKKRLVVQHFGLKADPACDVDAARVLRPVGTTWRKQEERVVRCAAVGAVSTLETLESALDAYITAQGLEHKVPSRASDVPEWMQTGDSNIAAQVMEFPPSSFMAIADVCQQIQLFRETGADAEPVWHAVAGVAKHCKDGETLFHEWSAVYEGYDRSEAQEKLDNWSAGPTTCDKFRSVNAAGCAGCKHQCKSPVQLGVDTTVDIVPKVEVAAEPSAEPSEKPAKKFVEPEFWPAGFSFDAKHETIYTHKQDDEGIPRRVNVASPLFYIVESIKKEDGTSALVVEVVIRGKKTQFELESKHTADAKSLKIQLAAYRIVTMDQNSVQAYVQQQLVAARQRADEINTYKQLGWHHNNETFLIGSKLITKDGSHPVRVGKAINSDLSNVGVSSGDPETWIDGVNELYNRPNAEPYQLAICLAFGGILGPFMPSAQWRGIPYALTSDDTGYGKSTVCKIGLNIYCPSTRTTVEDSTPKGIPIRTSAMGNLPFLLDEVTKYIVEPSDMSDLLYALSNGNTRIGARSDGTERDRLPGWNVPVLITGNRNIMHHVTEHKLNPAATQARVFEVDLELYPRLATLDKTSPEYADHGEAHKALTDNLIANHYGVIGEEWVRWVIGNRGVITAKLEEVGVKMRRAMYGGDASKERFYYDLATLMLVGGYFAKKQGYIHFDLNNLRTWIVQHVAKLRTTVDENRSTPEDLFANFMSDMNGRLLITNRFDSSDLRSPASAEMVQETIRGPVDGRVIRGTETERPRVYITMRAVTAWCAKNGVQYTKFKRDLISLRLIRLGTPGCNQSSGCVRVNLGKGVVGYEHLGRASCLEFDVDGSRKYLNKPATVVAMGQDSEVAA